MIITNIQRMCLDDGPGIRTTVFLKGCPLHCAWCHNPECISAYGTVKFWENWKKGFVFDGNMDALCKRLSKDAAFFQASGGGITISGGEPLLYPEFLGELGKLLGQKSISMVVDTCGLVPWSNFQAILDVTELFLYDLKGWDSMLHQELTGRGNKCIWDNFYRLIETGKNIWVRIPVVQGGNSCDLKNIVEHIPAAKNIRQVNLLPYHEFGIEKYQKLGRKYQRERFQKPDMGILEDARTILRKKDILGLIQGK